MKKSAKSKYAEKSGYVVIVAALVLLAVTGGMAAAITMLSVGANQSAEALRQGEQALLFSESCMEEGILRLIRDYDYAGDNFHINGRECEVGVEKDGDDHVIRAEAANNKFARAVKAMVLLSESEISIRSWKEQ